MAYINEFGQTVVCTVTNPQRLNNMLGNWAYIILPLILLISGYFLLRRYVKNKSALIIYIVVSVLVMIGILYISWFNLTCE